MAVSLENADFTSGGLLVASFARPGKLFTASAGLMARSVGVLNAAALDRVVGEVLRLLRPTSHP
jgi:hypothetical protein